MIILWLSPQRSSDELKSQSVDPPGAKLAGENQCVVIFENGKVKGELKGLSIAEVVTGPTARVTLRLVSEPTIEKPTK